MFKFLKEQDDYKTRYFELVDILRVILKENARLSDKVIDLEKQIHDLKHDQT